jgi:hypothetical protein
MTAPISPELYAEFIEESTHAERIQQLKKYMTIRHSGAWREIPREHRELMSANAETLQSAISAYTPPPSTPIIPTDTGHEDTSA